MIRPTQNTILHVTYSEHVCYKVIAQDESALPRRASGQVNWISSDEHDRSLASFYLWRILSKSTVEENTKL